ncbi:MAG: type II toxin-antitoxin system HicB family antitoxin [Immundisolibacterales bacterium]|nr:type II toxin-antitoxin system HicB family antitoxin [Immundisolibacterales bacterium]
MRFTVETEAEEDGRWIAEIVELPGAMQYGGSRGEAVARAEALALRVLAERIETGDRPAEPIEITFAPAA